MKLSVRGDESSPSAIVKQYQAPIKRATGIDR